MKIGYLMQEGVADVLESPPSGPSVHVIRVIEEVKKLGHQVVLVVKSGRQVCISEDLIAFQRIDLDALDRGIFRLFERGIRRIQSVLHLPYANFFDSLRFAIACRKALSDCDILYERFGWIGYGGWMAARLLHVPIIWELNGDHLTELSSHGYPLAGAQKWLSLKLMRRIARSVDHTVATGNGWRQTHISRWGVSPSKVSVIENGSQIVDLLSKSELRSVQDFVDSREDIRIVYLGAFEPWHGIKNLVRAVSAAMQAFPALHLDLIGDGPERQEIIQLIHTLNLDAVVNLTGPLGVGEVLPFLRNADIGVSPYCGRAEFSGLKLLDYKSAGLAIIASGQDGQPDVLAHGHTGWIVPPCDENALSEAIICLARDGELRKKIGRAARLDAEQLHGWGHTAQHLERLFQKVLSA